MWSRVRPSPVWVAIFLVAWHVEASGENRTRCGTPLLPGGAVGAGVSKPVPGLQTASPFRVGDALTVPAYDFRLTGGEYYQTSTTCRLVGEHCYVFVEDEVWGTPRVTQSGIEALARAFDAATARYPGRGIFSVDTDLFGPAPDVDGDPRILIVALDVLDSPITGTTYTWYFDIDNEAAPVSREIVYIDTNPLPLDSDLARATLTHEFQHMLHWRADPDEEKWITEGCSEYAELACGYKDTTETAAFFHLDLPNTGLTVWEDQAYEFDQAFLFMTYFAERYGETALRGLVAEPENGIAAIDLILESLALPERFEDFYADWAAAVYFDGPGRLGYGGLALGPVRRDTVEVPVSEAARKVRLWGTDYLWLKPAEGAAAEGLSIEVGGSGDNGLRVVLMTDGDSGPAAASFPAVADSSLHVNTFGPYKRALAVIGTSGTSEDYAFAVTELDGRSSGASDFDRSGKVDFQDFLAFAGQYGRRAGSSGFHPTFDLDGDRRVGFTDFLIFAGNFGLTP